MCVSGMFFQTRNCTKSFKLSVESCQFSRPHKCANHYYRDWVYLTHFCCQKHSTHWDPVGSRCISHQTICHLICNTQHEIASCYPGNHRNEYMGFKMLTSSYRAEMLCISAFFRALFLLFFWHLMHLFILIQACTTSMSM